MATRSWFFKARHFAANFFGADVEVVEPPQTVQTGGGYHPLWWVTRPDPQDAKTFGDILYLDFVLFPGDATGNATAKSETLVSSFGISIEGSAAQEWETPAGFILVPLELHEGAASGDAMTSPENIKIDFRPISGKASVSVSVSGGVFGIDLSMAA